jgi:hypothetical protein
MESALPPRAAIFNAFNNIGDSGVLMVLFEVDCRLKVVVLSKEDEPPSPPLRSCDDILDLDFDLLLVGLGGVWGA